MAVEYASIEVRRQGNKTIVIGKGMTGRGQRYIKAHTTIDAESPRDPKYKSEIASAVAKLFAEKLPL